MNDPNNHVMMVSLGIAIFLIIFGLIIGLKYRLIYKRNKRTNELIKNASEVASSMKSGQTIVKTLDTINDDKISEFLSAFPGNEFKTSMHTRKINEYTEFHYTTVIKIYKKELNEMTH